MCSNGISSEMHKQNNIYTCILGNLIHLSLINCCNTDCTDNRAILEKIWRHAIRVKKKKIIIIMYTMIKVSNGRNKFIYSSFTSLTLWPSLGSSWSVSHDTSNKLKNIKRSMCSRFLGSRSFLIERVDTKIAIKIRVQ